MTLVLDGVQLLEGKTKFDSCLHKNFDLIRLVKKKLKKKFFHFHLTYS